MQFERKVYNFCLEIPSHVKVVKVITTQIRQRKRFFAGKNLLQTDAIHWKLIVTLTARLSSLKNVQRIPTVGKVRLMVTVDVERLFIFNVLEKSTFFKIIINS